VLGERSAKAIEGSNAVELRDGLGVASLVLDRLAVDQRGASVTRVKEVIAVSPAWRVSGADAMRPIRTTRLFMG
jgi:hypothetical protein